MAQVALVLVIIAGLAVFALLNRTYLQWPTTVTDVTALPTSANITTIAAVPATPTALSMTTTLPATPTPVPPTGTSTPSPTPSPTLSPSPTPTVPPAAAVATGATLAAATTIAVLPPPLGVLRLSPGKDDHTFRLALGPVKLPPAGAHYELWLRNDNAPPLNLGTLSVEQGEISVAGSHQENLLANYNQAVITLERDDDPATMANTALFASQWPVGFATALRQLLVDNGVTQQGFLTGAATQSQHAFAQSAALQAALAKADLAAAQREAEGILNRLEGTQAAVTGDKNKEGQPDDPGAGFGIRPYLAATHEQLLLVSQITATAELAINTHYAVTLVQALQPVAATAAAQARQLVAAASVAEAQPFADELQRLLASLLKGVDQDGNGLIEPAHGEGGLQTVETLARALAQYPFGDKALGLGSAAADTITLPAAAVGTLWFSEEAVTTPITTTATQPPPLRFTLSLATLAQPPAGYHYELWLAGDENAAALQLARVPVHDGSVRLVGQLAQNPFADAHGLLLALTADDATAQTVGAPVYHSAAPRDELRGVLRQLLGPVEGGEQGLLLGLRTQLWQAHAQVALMQEALDADNVEQVRSYAEYIVHTLAGKAGYGDLDGDGKSPPLANPVSVREYLQQARKQTVQLSPLVTASPRTRFYTARALATYDYSLDLVEQATDKAIQIFAADTIADVRPFVDELAHLLTLALAGDDRDGNGMIDPLADEGAVLALFNLVAQVGEYPIYRLEPSAQVK